MAREESSASAPGTFPQRAVPWSELGALPRALPLIAVAAYLWLLHRGGVLSKDHFLLGGAVLALTYSGRLPRRLLRFLLPLVLTAVAYDATRYVPMSERGPVRVEEPYLFDQRWFGVAGPDGRTLTLPEWWQAHTHPALDFVAGAYYLLFIPIFVLFSAYYFFYRSRKGTRRHAPVEVAAIAPRLMWSFFWVNVMGYVTYFAYPAAPPWYVAQYGLGPAVLDAQPFAAGALRFDRLLDVHVFEDMYSKGAAVFGAIPSLHCAYPVIALYWALRLGHGRIFALLYWIGMVFSATYLNHHYVVDALWGGAYAVIGCVAVDQWCRARHGV